MSDAARGHHCPEWLRHGWRRVVLGLGAGSAAALVVALTIGLPTGRLTGAEDNGDGYRLFCGLGMRPLTTDGWAAWKGGVVTDFAVGPPMCGMSMPSSAGLVLRGAMLGGDGALSLTTVAWWYAVLVGLVVAVAAWAASASGLWRAAVLVIPVAPLALAPFSRFFLSTYSEPAGLLGVVAMACGVAALAVTGPERRAARTVAMVLVVLGGGVAATAKVAYVPAFVVAVAVVAVVHLRRHRTQRLVRTALVALVTVAAVAVPVGAMTHFQQQIYEGANVHDVVFTMAVPELGPGGPAELGLPPDAAAIAGDGFFNGPPRPTAQWWVTAIRDRPGALRTDALLAVATHPSALLRATGVGLQATTGADLPYLASNPADPARPTALRGDVGWSGARQPELRLTLDLPRPVPPWLPTVVVLVALAAAVSTVGWRRRAPVAARWCLAAGLGATLTLGLVAMALVGDGYFEVFKHVWLAAYVLVLTGLALLGAAAAALTTVARSARRPIPDERAVRAEPAGTNAAPPPATAPEPAGERSLV